MIPFIFEDAFYYRYAKKMIVTIMGTYGYSVGTCRLIIIIDEMHMWTRFIECSAYVL